jgi:hypothetical protein
MNRKKQRKAPWIICPGCEGEGVIDTLGVVHDRDDWDEDAIAEYAAGAYDRQCEICEGLGKVREDYEETDGPVIERFTLDGAKVFYRSEEDASEHHLRMMGG